MKYKKIKVKVKPKQKEQQTIKLDDEQVKSIIDEITELTEWSTNKIVDESHPILSEKIENRSKKDKFSCVIRLGLCFLFCGFGVLMITFIISNWKTLCISGINKFSIAITFFIAIICIVLGCDILREKDRNYLISLFSALVSLTALFVAIFKY